MGLAIGDMVSGLRALPGFRYACVADPESGAVLGESGTADVAAQSVLRWAREAAGVLAEGPDGGLDDLILTSRAAYHLVRPLGREGLLLYLCVDRSRSNLAVSRRELGAVRLGGATADRAVPDGPTATVGAGQAPKSAATAPRVPLASRMTIGRRGAPPPGPAEPERSSPVPLPRRSPAALPPPARRTPIPVPEPGLAGVPVPRAGLPVPPDGREWSQDIASIKRLLAGLRAMM